MATDQKVSEHYEHGSLLEAIEVGLQELGLIPGTATIHDLAPVDEFHIGGRVASSHFLDQLGLTSDMRVLDIGCGLGGGARFVAETYNTRVTGIDLTAEYVETGQVLSSWVGLADQVALQQASALAMPFPDQTFDGAYMMHVGMNIEDKEQLFAEVHRVLKTGGCFGIYDIMRTGSDDPTFPVPWAAGASTSWLRGPADYRRLLEASGFAVSADNDRRDFALDFFAKVKAANKTGGPPPLGLHTLMQQATAEKVGNMVASITSGQIAPTEMIAQKL